MRQATFSCANNRSIHPGESRGQSVVELALMLPVLVLVLAGILDLGRMYYSYITVVNATREGVRYAAANPPTPCNPSGATAIIARTRNEVQSSGINPGQLTVVVTCPDGQNTYEHPVRVQVSYDFHLILARILNLGSLRLRSDAQMQIFAQ